MLGNSVSGNTARGNSPPADAEPFSFSSDLRISVRVNDYSDLALDIGQATLFDSDLRIYVSNDVDFYSDLKLVIDENIDENTDVFIRVFNPTPFTEGSDLYLQVINPEDIDEDSDLLIDVGTALTFDSDVELEVVEGVDFKSDVELIINQALEFYTDLTFHIHTDPDDPEVIKIATILDRRFLPYQPDYVQFRQGTDTERYKLVWTVATSEWNTRQNIEKMIKGLRLLHATGTLLDRVADRVGERRWQFYDDRVDRFESDTCFRNRLIPYWQELRGTLGSLQAATQPLHDCYGGYSSFFSYEIGEGWLLGMTGRTELGATTYLGGPLMTLDPMEHLDVAEIWVLGETGYSELGATTWLGDRERLSPFTFFIDVWNYPTDAAWRELYLHTIDRFKAAGTVAIVVFRQGAVMNHYTLTGDGTTSYTVPNYHLQGKTCIVTLNGLAQTPTTAYTLTNSGTDTLLEFDASDPGAPAVGDEIVVYWLDEG